MSIPRSWSTWRAGRPAGALAAALLLTGAASPAAAQVMFCLTDGVQIQAERFEQRDGRFIIWVAGSPTPLEYPATAVRGINVPCVRTAAPALPQPLPPSSQQLAQPVAGIGIHGSNTIGERLMPLLIEAYSTRRLGGRPTTKLGKPEQQEITLPARDGRASIIHLHAHGSGTSAKGLLAGQAVIGMSSRRATDDETKAVQSQLGVDIRAPGSEHVLALDGLAVIVNPANRVRRLTLQQIAQVFAGQITDWSQLGGAAQPIVAHRRDDKSGTFDTFNALVLAPFKLKPAPAVKAHESSENLSDEVSRDPNAIGFIGLPYINRNVAVSIGTACGIASGPSTFTVKTESYPLSRRLFLYTVGTPTEPRARDLLAFALSDEAQPTVAEAGFVEQSIETQSEADQQAWLQSMITGQGFLAADKPVPPEARAQLQRLAAGARRTSGVLRFDRGSATLDTRAQQDVGRIARYLRTPGVAGKRFWLVGFTDADGGWGGNLLLARNRALSVARALQQIGIATPGEQVIGMSYVAPTDCNDGDNGKLKNRRVELWVQR